jgi:DNA-binding GntR family transcriptional regulator
MTEDPRAFVQMALDLARQIDSGEIKPGNPVPSITEMSKKYCHARMTCSKALQMLESGGILMRIPGKGYYIK